MDKKQIIEYLYVYASKFGGLDTALAANSDLYNSFFAVNEETSYKELYSLVKKGNSILGEALKDKVLEEYLMKMAVKEEMDAQKSKEENLEEKKEAKGNIYNCENPSREAVKDFVENTKDSAEKDGNFLRVHVSLVDENKIKVDITQFGDNINGSEAGYSLTFDRHEFNMQDVMSVINESYIGDDKVDSSDNQRFYNGRSMETNMGHQLIIDPEVEEAIRVTDDYMERNKKGNPRVRKDDHKNDTATSNVVVIALILFVIIVGAYIFFIL